MGETDPDTNPDRGTLDTDTNPDTDTLDTDTFARDTPPQELKFKSDCTNVNQIVGIHFTL